MSRAKHLPGCPCSRCRGAGVTLATMAHAHPVKAVRIREDLHRRARIAAVTGGVSLEEWLNAAIIAALTVGPEELARLGSEVRESEEKSR